MKHVLVAEDDPELRSIVASLLRADGYRVTEVADGGRLLVFLAQAVRTRVDVPDLVLTDVRMPVVRGTAIVQAVRELDHPIPLILMSAFPGESLHVVARKHGVPLLEKPFEASTLRSAVSAALRRG